MSSPPIIATSPTLPPRPHPRERVPPFQAVSSRCPRPSGTHSSQTSRIKQPRKRPVRLFLPRGRGGGELHFELEASHSEAQRAAPDPIASLAEAPGHVQVGGSQRSCVVSFTRVGLGSQSSDTQDAVPRVKPTQRKRRWILPAKPGEAAGERASHGSINQTSPAEPPGDRQVSRVAWPSGGSGGRPPTAVVWLAEACQTQTVRPDGARRGCEGASASRHCPRLGPDLGQFPRLSHWTRPGSPTGHGASRPARDAALGQGSPPTGRLRLLQRTNPGAVSGRQRAGRRAVPTPHPAGKQWHPNPRLQVTRVTGGTGDQDEEEVGDSLLGLAFYRGTCGLEKLQEAGWGQRSPRENRQPRLWAAAGGQRAGRRGPAQPAPSSVPCCRAQTSLQQRPPRAQARPSPSSRTQAPCPLQP